MNSQDYTVEQAIDRNKPDKFGNKTYDVKFREDERMVYVASKSPLSVGDRKHGYIEANDYGNRFKSVMKQDNTGSPQAAHSFTPRSPQAGKKSDDERSDDIRWGLCLKEANFYLTKNESEMDEETWADAVKRYASALYKVSDSPIITEVQDQLNPNDLPL